MLDLKLVDKTWTLFLDRDGVINIENPDGYIYSPEEFVFYEGIPEAIRILSNVFAYIIVVTNQRGIGKELMSDADLGEIHDKMLRIIEMEGGRIDRIYYCSSLRNEDPFRKPNPGMAIQSKKDFPLIDFSKSIMVGNTLSDMEFGRNAGMRTVFVKTTHPSLQIPPHMADRAFENLVDFAKAWQDC